MPRKADDFTEVPKVITPGDSGIWATCNKGKEGACVGELRVLFNEYAELLYGGLAAADASTGASDKPSIGIENEIYEEVAELQRPSAVQLFTHIRIDVPCGRC